MSGWVCQSVDTLDNGSHTGDSGSDGNGGGNDKCRGMISRTGCTKHGAMGNVQSMSNRRGKSSSNGRSRSDGLDMVQQGDSGTLLAPDVTMQCVGCDDTQHSVEAAPQDVHGMFGTTNGKSTSRMIQIEGVDAVPCVLIVK